MGYRDRRRHATCIDVLTDMHCLFIQDCLASSPGSLLQRIGKVWPRPWLNYMSNPAPRARLQSVNRRAIARRCLDLRNQVLICPVVLVQVGSHKKTRPCLIVACCYTSRIPPLSRLLYRQNAFHCSTSGRGLGCSHVRSRCSKSCRRSQHD